MPNSTARSSSVIGSSASRRASKMRRSRWPSTASASPSAFLRFSNCSLSASRVSWSEASSTSQSCHSPELTSSRIGALSDMSPPRRRFMSITSRSVTQALRNQLDLVGAQVALFQRRDFALGLAQIEEQLLLVGGGAHLHQRPRAQDVFLDRRLDPPHGIGGEPKTFLRIEALGRLHQPEIAFRDELGDRQPVTAIAHGNLDDQ